MAVDFQKTLSSSSSVLVPEGPLEDQKLTPDSLDKASQKRRCCSCCYSCCCLTITVSSSLLFLLCFVAYFIVLVYEYDCQKSLGFTEYQLSDLTELVGYGWRFPWVWRRCYREVFPHSIGSCYAENADLGGLLTGGKGLESGDNLEQLGNCVVGLWLGLYGPGSRQEPPHPPASRAGKQEAGVVPAVWEKAADFLARSAALSAGATGGPPIKAHKFSEEEREQIKKGLEKRVAESDGKKAILHVRTGDVINNSVADDYSVKELLDKPRPIQWGRIVLCYIMDRHEFTDVMRWPPSLREVVLVTNPNHGTSANRTNEKSMQYMEEVKKIVVERCSQAAQTPCVVSMKIAANFERAPEKHLEKIAADADNDIVYFTLSGGASYLYTGGGGFGMLVAQIAHNLKSVKVAYGGSGYKKIPGKISDGVSCVRETGWPEKGWDKEL